MVGTIGFAGGKARIQRKVFRFARRIALPYALASIAGGAILGLAAALVGGLALPQPGDAEAETSVVASVLAVAGAADAFGISVKRFSRRRQVPLSWKHVFPPPMSATLYGFTLGVGVVTAIYYWSFLAFLVAVAVTADPALGVMAGIAFSLGRAALSLLAVAARDEWVIDRWSDRIEGVLSRNRWFPRLVSATVMWAAAWVIIA